MSSDTEDETGPDEVAELAAFDAAKYERLELIRRATIHVQERQRAEGRALQGPLRPSRRLQHVVTESQNVKSDVIWV